MHAPCLLESNIIEYEIETALFTKHSSKDFLSKGGVQQELFWQCLLMPPYENISKACGGEQVV